ncbi:MAG: hypothetical protein ACKOCD_06315, partial [Nitrospiraceae bacterium]
TPHRPGGGDPCPLFMDQAHSHEVRWLPAPDPPRRYFDQAHRLCITIRGEIVLKATKADDPTGLPFVKPNATGLAPCERSVSVSGGALRLESRGQTLTIPLNSAWGKLKDNEAGAKGAELRGEGWQSVFRGSPFAVEPVQAFAAVLIYPDDDREIGELEAQPFVADYLQDMIEQVPELSSRISRSTNILIHGFDAAITACARLDQPRNHTVLYDQPAFAQKQAQLLWNQLAQAGHLDWLSRVKFLPATGQDESAYKQLYDVIFAWVPYQDHAQADRLQRACRRVASALQPGGLIFLVGPHTMHTHLASAGLTLLQQTPVEDLPTFAMHRTILPTARLKPELMLFLVTKH